MVNGRSEPGQEGHCGDAALSRIARDAAAPALTRLIAVRKNWHFVAS